MAKTKKEFIYSGIVLQFGVCVERNWNASTWAYNKKKALSNLIYRYKKDHNLNVKAKIELPGELTMRGIDD